MFSDNLANKFSEIDYTIMFLMLMKYFSCIFCRTCVFCAELFTVLSVSMCMFGLIVTYVDLQCVLYLYFHEVNYDCF